MPICAYSRAFAQCSYQPIPLYHHTTIHNTQQIESTARAVWPLYPIHIILPILPVFSPSLYLLASVQSTSWSFLLSQPPSTLPPLSSQYDCPFLPPFFPLTRPPKPAPVPFSSLFFPFSSTPLPTYRLLHRYICLAFVDSARHLLSFLQLTFSLSRWLRSVASSLSLAMVPAVRPVCSCK